MTLPPPSSPGDTARGLRRGRRHRTASLSLGLWIAATACSDFEPQRIDISIAGLAFVSDTTRVARGDSVVWTNRDVVPHTVTLPGAVDSGELVTGAMYGTVFETVGIVSYTCLYHPTMQGVVIVHDDS